MTAAKAKEPNDLRAWEYLGLAPGADFPIHRWRSGPVHVHSSLVVADMPDGNGTGEQWLISVSANGKRPKSNHCRRALRAFDMVDAENDNHHPGVAMHYFLVVDPARRVACECKTTERVVVAGSGYRWTNPKPETGEACRGCEYQRLTGKPCPLHAEART